MTSAIRSIEGRAIVLRGDDIDTDRIMPARFLKAITFEGLEAHVFTDDRAAARQAGTPHPLDAADAPGASILMTGANFGCGSSREHAPQALRRWGIEAIVAASFSPIFAGNAQAIGLVCVSLEGTALEALMTLVESRREGRWQVDLEARRLTAPTGSVTPIHLTDAQQHAWLSGEWDATGLLLADYDEVARVDARLPYLRATSRNT